MYPVPEPFPPRAPAPPLRAPARARALFGARRAAPRAAFGRVAWSCGLPACAGPLLFRAVARVSAAVEGVSPPASPAAPAAPAARPPRAAAALVGLDAFESYWRGRVMRAGAGAVWNVIVDAGEEEGGVGEGGGRKAEFEGLIRMLEGGEGGGDGGGGREGDGLCGLGGVDRVVGEMVREYVRNRGRLGLLARVDAGDAVAIATGGLLAGLRARARRPVVGWVAVVGEREVVGGRLGDVLRRAEGGDFCGLGRVLSMEGIVAVGEAWEKGRTGLGVSDRVWEEVVRVAGRGGQVGPHAFAVLVQSLWDAGGAVACEFWFDVLDGDGDGIVGRGDVHDLYKSKVLMRERRGVSCVASEDVWRSVCDRVGCGGAGVQKAAWRRMGDAERKTVVEAILFREDGGATIDVRKHRRGRKRVRK